jgi:hypothetical protein
VFLFFFFVFGHAAETDFYCNLNCSLPLSGWRNSFGEEGFRSALYMIDIGQNDLLLALYASNLTYAPVIEKIPSFLAEIKLALQVSIILFIRILIK